MNDALTSYMQYIHFKFSDYHRSWRTLFFMFLCVLPISEVPIHAGKTLSCARLSYWKKFQIFSKIDSANEGSAN